MVLVLGLFRLMVALGVVEQPEPAGRDPMVRSNLAFTIMMLQNYFDTIAVDLEEAAWIDGATRLQSLLRIFLPLAVPAMVVTALFTFINAWNEFVLALTLLRTSDKLYAAGPGLLPGRRPVPDRMAPRHGGDAAGHRPGGDRLRLAAALPDPRHESGQHQMTDTFPVPRHDLILAGGRVIDPAQGLDGDDGRSPSPTAKWRAGRAGDRPRRPRG